jgi:ribonuclease P protein component
MLLVTVKGEQYLTKDFQYGNVYEHGKTWVNRHLVVKTVSTQASITRYGFSVSKRVGKAVVRNLVKRRLREIVRKESLKPGWDLVIIARPPSARLAYPELQSSLIKLLKKAGLIVGNNEGSGPQAD